MTVTVRDPFGNVVTGYVGAVHFTSSDTRATLPADYTFTAAAAGVHTFSVTLVAALAQTVTVADAVNPALMGQARITVNPTAIASFSVSGFPATTAGVAQTFTVMALDAFGNLASGYNGTVTFSSSDVQAGLPASYTFTAADGGFHTFSATLKTAGSQSISVQDASAGAAGTQSAIAVAASTTVTHFSLTAPSSATTGKSFTVTAAALDAFGNVVTGYRGKVHFTDTLSAGLRSDYTFSATDSGSHVFTVTLNTLGLQTLKLTDTLNTQIFGAVNITATATVTGGTGGGGTGGGGTGGGGTGGGGGKTPA